jgi:hypothetical protein
MSTPPDFQAIASAWAQTAQNLAAENAQLRAELALVRNQLAARDVAPVAQPSSDR